jgi:queuosine precursor transporter
MTMTNFKFLSQITIFYVCFQLISDVTASKLILLFGQPVSITVLYFPFTYIIADILTEVYGLKRANRILLQVLFCSVLAGIVYQLAIFIPSVQGLQTDLSFQTVLGAVPRVLVGGWLAVWLGGLCNNYIMSLLKKFTNSKMLWLRTITSTVFGELVNTGVFFMIGLAGVIPDEILLQSILWSWIFKVCVEVVMTPFTYRVVEFLKGGERENFTTL